MTAQVGGFLSNAITIDTRAIPDTGEPVPKDRPQSPAMSLVRATTAKSIHEQTFEPMLETSTFFTSDYAVYAWVYAKADYVGQTLRWGFRWIQPDGTYFDSISPWWTYGAIDAQASSWLSNYGYSLQLGQWEVEFWIQPLYGNWVYLTAKPFTLQSGILCNQYVTNGGFEAGNQGWQQSSNVAVNSSFPHWGSQVAVLGNGNSQSYYLFQEVQIPSLYSQSPVLALYYNIYSEDSSAVAYDILHIQIRNQTGSLLRTLDVNDNRHYYSRNPPDVWQPFTWDMSDFAGQTVRIYFAAETDSVWVTRWYIDDVSLTACPLSQPETREQRLAKRFSPIVFVHPNDIFWPNRVTVLLNDSQLKSGSNQVVVENPTETTFNESQYLNKEYYLDIENKSPNPLTGDSQVYQNYYAQLDRNTYPAFLYARVVDKDGQQNLDGCSHCTVVQYWFFYYFNNWYNKHEGDWEMMQVVLDRDRNDTPVRLGYAQHKWGTRLDWQRLSFHTGEHPWVFVGKGSHASYFSPGTYRPWAFPDETVGSGTVILPPDIDDTNIYRYAPNTLTRWREPFPYILSTGSPSWINYQGRWGHDGWPIGFLGGDAPDGPRFNSSGQKWNDPLVWMRSLQDDSIWWINLNHSLQADITGALDLHLYDAQNRHVGPNASGGVDLQIPGSEFRIDPGEPSQYIRVSPASLTEGYRIELRSHGSGQFSLAVGMSDFAASSSYGAWHTDIAFGPQTVGQIVFNQLASLTQAAATQAPNMTLQLDRNGDGSFETQVSPTVTLQSPLDTIPPMPITNLAATTEPNRPNSVRLRWTAPSDTGGSGGVTRYEIRYAPIPITNSNWQTATQAQDVLVPGPAGQLEIYDVSGLSLAQSLYFAVRSVDASHNVSPLSNLVVVQSRRTYLPLVRR
ncbi:MAG: hypothetical protein M1546_09220 [Chloroflexi bacterium]|nr:hypothetical protein [Chloroflexota bacterium]